MREQSIGMKLRGCVGAVIAQNGAVEQRTLYYPYGAPYRSDSPEANPYKFSGKQLEMRQGLNMAFHGSRLYFADLGRFASPDIFADRYHWLSPWSYCAANPLNLTDPSGNYFINSRDDIENFKDNVRSQINTNENLISTYRYVGSSDGNDYTEAINLLSKEISYLKNCISAVERLQFDRIQAYYWDKSPQKDNMHMVVNHPKWIVIQGSSDAMFGHELLHIDQYLGKKLKFNSDGKLIAPTDNGSIVSKNEVDAYRTQYAIDHSAMPDFIDAPRDIKDINTEYLEKINKKTNAYDYITGVRKNLKQCIDSNDPNKEYYEDFY